MLSTLKKLKHGQAVTIPNYDIKSHKRIEPARQVLICILEIRHILPHYDMFGKGSGLLDDY